MKIGLLVLCLSFVSGATCFSQENEKLQIIIDLLNNDVIPALNKSEGHESDNCKKSIDSLQTILLVSNKREGLLKAELTTEMDRNLVLVESLKLLQSECQNMIESLKTQGSNISTLLLSSIESTANTLTKSGYPANNVSLIGEFKTRLLAVTSANKFMKDRLTSLNSIDAEIEKLHSAFSTKSEFKELEGEKENLADVMSIYKELTCELKAKMEEVKMLEYPGHTSLLELQARLNSYNLIAKFPYLMDCIESFSDAPSKNPLAHIKGTCN